MVLRHEGHVRYVGGHELEAILVKGVFPPLITLFRAKTAVGETIEFKTNGSGYWELLLVRP